MPTTTLSQYCSVITDANGAVSFQIVSTVDTLKPGDLPSIFVFVYNIVTTTDPKADVFVRVANVYDLTTIARGRDAALSAGQKTYLGNSVTVAYGDIDTAVQVKEVIQARVDALIQDWIAYSTQFLSGTVDLPLVSASIIQERQTSFYAARTAKATADAAKAAALTAYTAAEADAARAKAAAEHAVQADIFFTACQTEITRHNEAEFITARDTFRAVEPTSQAAAAAYSAALATQVTAQQALIVADAEVAKRGADLAAATAAVLEVCPTFNINA